MEHFIAASCQGVGQNWYKQHLSCQLEMSVQSFMGVLRCHPMKFFKSLSSSLHFGAFLAAKLVPVDIGTSYRTCLSVHKIPMSEAVSVI